MNSENESFEENKKEKNKQLTFYKLYFRIYALEKDITEEIKISKNLPFVREETNI